MLQGFDPYGERLAIPEITKSPLVLPLANDAPLYYRYKIIGEVWDGEEFSYRIAFEPKNPQTGLPGYLILADESYALRGMELSPHRCAGNAVRRHHPPSHAIRPSRSLLGSAEIQFRARLKVELLGFQIAFLAEGHFLYRRYTLLQVQKPRSAPAARRPTPSTPSPPSDKASAAFHLDTVAIVRLDFSERLRVLEGAEKPENAFWDSLRRVPLDTFQQRYIQQSDSLLQREDPASPSPKRRPSFSLRSEGLELSMRRGKGDATWSSELVGLWPGYTTLEGWVLQGKGAIQHARRGALWEGAFSRPRYADRAAPRAARSWLHLSPATLPPAHRRGFWAPAGGKL